MMRSCARDERPNLGQPRPSSQAMQRLDDTVTARGLTRSGDSRRGAGTGGVSSPRIVREMGLGGGCDGALPVAVFGRERLTAAYLANPRLPGLMSVQPSPTSPVAYLLDVNRWLERSGVTIR